MSDITKMSRSLNDSTAALPSGLAINLPMNQRLIEVYLFGKKKKGLKQQRKDLQGLDLKIPISRQFEIDEEIPIFIDKHQACNYGRFLTANFCLIKAFVFDLAIESKGNQLHLRKSYFHWTMIHGLYASTTDLKVYFKNSEFDARLLKAEETEV